MTLLESNRSAVWRDHTAECLDDHRASSRAAAQPGPVRLIVEPVSQSQGGSRCVSLREPAQRPSTAFDAPSRRSTGDDLDTLVRRLDDGTPGSSSARARGEDVTAWEEFWIDLLHEYEALPSTLFQKPPDRRSHSID